MRKKGKFIALGDIIADFYYDEQQHLIKIDGGATRFNVIANLAALGSATKIISCCGDNKINSLILKYMEDLEVNTTCVEKAGKGIRIYHLTKQKTEYTSTKICPRCKRKTWSKQVTVQEFVFKQIGQDDVIILDGINEENIDVFSELPNPKVLDIGRIRILKEMSDTQIVKILQGNIEILQLNETVEQYLLERLRIKTTKELYFLLRPKLLIITRGKKGAEFLSGTRRYVKQLNNYSHEIDTTGAGDAFLSVVIQNYYDNNRIVDEEFVERTFAKANEVTSKVVQKIGARGHLYTGYYPITEHICICELHEA